MARTKTTARLTRRAQQLVKRAASMGGEEVVLRFHPQHDIARADQDGSDEEYEVCVHGGLPSSPGLAIALNWRSQPTPGKKRYQGSAP